MERDLKCMYCAEMGITNTDVFIEIVDVELGHGWICKECFIESEKEKDEHLKELEEQLQAKEQECERLKETFDGLFKVQYKLADNNKKLRQCLTEIKNKLTVHKTLYYESKLIEKLHKQIIQKISECEGNDE